MTEHATDPDLPPAGWTEEAVHLHRIGVEPHSVSVGTAREDMVESMITVHESAPAVEATAEHIVEADLAAPTGRLTVSSPGVHPKDGPGITVPAGLLRVRVSYLPCDPPAGDTDGGPGDHYLYRIDVWPTARTRELDVLKQGPNPWA
ncbi:hypothetical protein ACFC26_30865 [Kitasatospora purpeofusca]|uniref:hypothetical protein n=1 Tax=Kitasatospora purpeofusca TaxID=67352 RepID=UPI0035DA8760